MAEVENTAKALKSAAKLAIAARRITGYSPSGNDAVNAVALSSAISDLRTALDDYDELIMARPMKIVFLKTTPSI